MTQAEAPTQDNPVSPKLLAMQEVIDECDKAYYQNGTSPLSDSEYDSLKAKLAKLAPDDPRLTRVGYAISRDEIGSKSQHSIPMGSLDNTDDYLNGVEPWFKKLGVDHPIFASYKMDGMSMALYYEDGKLVKAITRGNGEVGEDVTANAIKWMYVPLNLKERLTLTVRGEAILHKADFQKLATDGGSDSNPRNVGAGIVGRHDGTDNELIRFYAFNIYRLDRPLQNEDYKYAVLENLGFTCAPHKLCNNVSEVADYYNQTNDIRQSLEFEIDGIVVCINNGEFNSSLITDRKSKLRPKFARAVKFPMYTALTTVTGCNITIGHNGVLCPTVTYEPVKVGGVVSSNANLNNWNESSEYPSAAHVCVGDMVSIGLAGDIIPKIVKVITHSPSNPPITEPTVCPFCGSSTTRNLRGKEGAATYCSNPGSCSGTLVQKIDHWIGTSKKGVGILDIGDGVLAAMIEANLVADPADLYKITVDMIQNLKVGAGKLGKSRATKIVDNINNKRNLSLPMFIGGLGIDLLGKRRVEIIQRSANGKLNTIDQWRDQDNLKSVIADGLGSPGEPSILREAIMVGMAECEPLIVKLLANGVTVDSSQVSASPSSGGLLAGRSFCFTGTRDYLDEVVAAGGTIKSGISRGLTFLVQKSVLSESKKTQKAEELGVKIIGIEYLREILDGKVSLDEL